MPRNSLSNVGEGVQDSGRCLAMYQSDMRDRGIACEQTFDVLRGRADVVGRFEYGEFAAHHLGELGHPLAVRAVDQDEHMTIARHQRINSRFDGKSAATLHRYADMRAVRLNHAKELFPHLARHGIEVRIPRTPVAQHRRLGLQRRGQWTGGQQNRIAGKVRHQWTFEGARSRGQPAADGLRHACVRVSNSRVTPA